MTNITELEGKIMNAIAHHEMNTTNGATPKEASDVCTWAWTQDFADEAGVDVKSAKGAMGSLTAKGFLHCSGKGRDASVGFTQEGFQAWKVWFDCDQRTKKWIAQLDAVESQ